MSAPRNDWNPETYHRFRGFRLRPALDLLARVPDLPPGDVVDLGCGSGGVGPVLAQRWQDRRIIGVDASPAMLAEATATGVYTDCIEQDIATWQPVHPPALIFSNAALQWLGDHKALLPALARKLAPGGVLAVQMPRQYAAASHQLLAKVAADLGFAPPDTKPQVRPAIDYMRLLRPLGQVEAWETEYVQQLDPVTQGHPVRTFTESTAMRPYVAGLTPDQVANFTAAYDMALAQAYPLDTKGTVLFPFLRCFFILKV